MLQKNMDLSFMSPINCLKETEGMVMSIMLVVGDRAGAH